MLRARLIDSVDSQNVTAILHSPEARKLLVAKENGDIEVYYREQGKLKLNQTYPKLLQSSQSEETRINGLYESYELSTVFARCDKSLLLFNSTNLHQYDRIVDRRGIDNCWIFEVLLPNNEEKNTFLVYSNKDTAKLRMLIWKGRTYERIVEATLSRDKETVKSALPGKSGILLATNLGLYHWSYGDSVLSRIDKIVKRKYPKDVVRQLAELESLSHSKVEKRDNATASLSMMSTSRITKKTSILNFWPKDHHRKCNSTMIRHLFKPKSDDIILLDGITKNSYALAMTESQLPYMVAADNSQFLDWNSSFSQVEYLSVNLIVLYNHNTIRFVDYENGFTFLEQHIPEGIRSFEKIEHCHFIVLTANGQLQLYRYNVDDGSDEGLGDEESICGILYDSDFYQLWRKVLFYGFFLDSPNALQLCSSDDPEESLDVCALKLRDLTVMWCLEIWTRLQSDMNALSRSNRIDRYTSKLESLVVIDLFERLTVFWAPPQLVILATFPPNIARLVTEITGQKHDRMQSESDESDSHSYIPSREVIRESHLPYLVQTRRRLRYMRHADEMTWDYAGRQVMVGIDFFSLDQHDSLDVSTLLTLVDTVLFMTYLYYFPSMVNPLLSVDSMCDYKTVVRELRERGMFQELVSFYFQREEHVEALKFLTDLYEDLHKKTDGETLRDGVKLLVTDYLKKLPKECQSLTFQYTDWLFARSDSKTDILESIFINDSPTFSDRNHYEIYTYINGHDRQIALEYLQFVISTFKVRDVKLHTCLIKRYFEDLNDNTTRLKLKSILEISSSYEPRTIFRLLQEATSDDKLPEEQKRFLNFLKVYPLQKLGNYEEAVHILYDELSDYNGSSIFCDRVYSKDKTEGQKILEYLFEKIISSSKGDRKHQIAVFIQEHGSKLDIIKIYKLLPRDLLLSDLKHVLLQTIKLHSIENDEKRIERGLFQAELVKKSYELNKSLANFVLLDDNYKCPVCKKRFQASSTDSALWYTVDFREVIVHYTCGKALESKIQAKSAKAKLRSSRVVADLKSET